MDRLAQALVALVLVPLATAAYVVLAERALSLLPQRRREQARPWLWLAPGLALLVVFLVYPSLQTAALSVFDAGSTAFVGLQNYAWLLGDQQFLVTLRNNLLWLVVFTGVTVLLGLTAAALADRVRYEGVVRAVLFLPMAISFVAAGVIWRFVYDFQPAGAPQTGVLNALLSAVVPGFEPQAWLVNEPWNNFAIIAAAVWTWTGFCMVVLSAALKGVPVELLEAARVDGATEWQVFRRVVLPMIAPTLGVVTTTMLIFALKAFDLVYVMTNGNYGTEVLANRMYKELFNVQDFGRASAIAVLLFMAILPIMALNLRRFRAQEREGR